MRNGQNEIVVNKCFDLVQFDLCRAGGTKHCIQLRCTNERKIMNEKWRWYIDIVWFSLFVKEVDLSPIFFIELCYHFSLYVRCSGRQAGRHRKIQSERDGLFSFFGYLFGLLFYDYFPLLFTFPCIIRHFVCHFSCLISDKRQINVKEAPIKSRSNDNVEKKTHTAFDLMPTKLSLFE